MFFKYCQKESDKKRAGRIDDFSIVMTGKNPKLSDKI